MVKEKLSALVFSRNDVEKALYLIKDIYQVADDIVLVDSSDRERRQRLYEEKERLGMKKLRIFYAVALGYPDPLRMWALKKCRHRWVLLIDTDERLSPRLKAEIKEIIQDYKCAAFGIRRYEDVEVGKRNDFFTWQIRLFDKKKVEFKGVPHDQPIIKGRLRKLPEEYYMEHAIRFKNYKREYDYERIIKFERYSYKMYNSMLLDFFERTTLPEGKKASETAFGRLLHGFLNAYETITLRSPEEEISNFDYFTYYVIKRYAVAIKRGDFWDFLHLIPGGLSYVKRINKWKTEKGGREFFEILKIIYDIGIIKFLEMDKDKTIKGLNQRYKEDEQGIDLLILLLRERYKKINRQNDN